MIAGTTIRDIAIVGLGNMGARMGARLVDAGFRVHGYDPVPEAREQLLDAGGYATSDLATAVRDCPVVVLMLPDSDVVEDVAQDLVRFATRDTVVVDMSSSEPMRTVALGKHLASTGLSLVDAPVSGGTSRAASGELTIMVGGDEELVSLLDPVFAALGTAVRVGSLGAGHAAKALNNLLSATHLLATAEAMTAGERFGLDPRVLLDVFNSSSGRSGSTEAKWPAFVLSDRFDSGFKLRLMLKDMNIALGLLEQVGTPDSLAIHATHQWAEAAEALPPDADHTEIARWVRRLSEPQE